MKKKVQALPPQRDKVIVCLENLWFLLFPYHYQNSKKKLGGYSTTLTTCKKELLGQINLALSPDKKENGREMMENFFLKLDGIKAKLSQDAQAAYERDVAAHSIDEVILCYPGFLALMTYRLAHALSKLKVPMIPRMMGEYAHSLTGCDIHPDAHIGDSLFIDHGTGVVIGQTAVIGSRVTVFQGVTLGALALQGKNSRAKRHPTIEDDVILYSHATILGGDTVIGKGSVIGGSCWITQSVPPYTKVILAKPQMVLESATKSIEYIPNWDI